MKMTENDNVIKALLKILLPSCLMAAAVFLTYIMWSEGAFLPRWFKWEEKEALDSSGEYEAALHKKCVYIKHNGTEIWTSPENIKVQDMHISDIDGDSDDELLLLVWKVGRYGDARPFWVDDNEAEIGKWSQHLFVYEFKDDKIKPKWMSSYLGTDVVSLDVGADGGINHLIFREKDGSYTKWRWDSWGFTIIGK